MKYLSSRMKEEQRGQGMVEFMIALPIFAAMLIGDAGYGLLFLLLPLLRYRKAVAAAGAAKVHLMIVIGGVAVVWGLLTGTIFGLNPTQIAGAGSIPAVIGRGLDRAWLIRGQLTEQHEKLVRQKRTLEQWADKRQDEADRQAARLVAREEQLRQKEAELADRSHSWQAERLRYREEIRRLESQLSVRDEAAALA